MIAQGRTYRQAVDAGNCYEVRGPGVAGIVYPQAETPAECWACLRGGAVAGYFTLEPGTYTVLRVKPGSTTGCQFVEDVATFAL